MVNTLSKPVSNSPITPILAEVPPPENTSREKILYGVQGTGNGHISRASAMNKALSDHGGYDVTWVMSGRPRQKNLMCCDDYTWYRGMTFFTRNGKVQTLKSIVGNNLFQFLSDTREIPLHMYDLIITDFEPVVAWAANKQKKEVIGLGHQYAFNYPVPFHGSNPFQKWTLRNFAPSGKKIGLHWHHFEQPILPPIVDMQWINLDQPVTENKVLVYLPFENQDELVQLLKRLPDWNFYIYSPEMVDYDIGNIHLRKISKTGFKMDLVTANAIICNSGFELISECLTLGKRILTKPLFGQIEQLSNARSLSELGYATILDRITQKDIEKWLKGRHALVVIDYPDVAAAITAWLEVRDSIEIEVLADRLWRQTVVRSIRQ